MRRQLVTTILSCLLTMPVLCAAGGDPQGSHDPRLARPPTPSNYYQTAFDYAVRFFPRWVSYSQSQSGPLTNHLVGPQGSQLTPDGQSIVPVYVGPELKIIVAANVDTVYAISFLDLSKEPMILTLPPYPYVYSLLQLDVFGSVLDLGKYYAPTSTGGVYALVGPDYTKDLPAGVTKVPMPYNSSELLIRIDRYNKPTNSNAYVDVTAEAASFRSQLRLQPLSTYPDATKGKFEALPLKALGRPMKRLGDQAMVLSAFDFFNTLQDALKVTAPLSASDQSLIQAFDDVFATAKKEGGAKMREVLRGGRDANTALINRWESHTGKTNWVHFNNVGEWGTKWLDRAALTEFIQYGNNCEAAYYAQSFVDEENEPLDGSNLFAYKITFQASQLPRYKRFWSITAYTPEDVELVPNTDNKYAVASYTPGLVTAADGSVSIYLQPNRPSKLELVPNWLPVPDGLFNVMLRIYGPEEGTSAYCGNYEPPIVERIPTL